MLLGILITLCFSCHGVLGQAQDLFFALQQSDSYLDTWVVRSCVKKMLARIKNWSKSDGGILERMKNYEFSEKDKALFARKWPNGMRVSRRGLIAVLEVWMQHVNCHAPDAPTPDSNESDQCLITEQTIETWIRTIGRLPEQTLPLLAKIDTSSHRQQNDDDPTDDPEFLATLAYLAWCGTATLLDDPSFCKFLCKSLLFRGICEGSTF